MHLVFIQNCFQPDKNQKYKNVLHAFKKMLYFIFLTFRHIQDPASQQLTWNKPPKSVLVIKKIRDASLLQPFKELCIFLTEVGTFFNITC